jgi:hypothetical protein
MKPQNNHAINVCYRETKNINQINYKMYATMKQKITQLNYYNYMKPQ